MVAILNFSKITSTLFLTKIFEFLHRVAKSVANVAHVPENARLLYSLNWITVTFEGVHSTSCRFSHPFDVFC